MATAVLVTNWGGASFMDAAYMSMFQHRNLVQSDNTSAVNAWINAESQQRQDINQQIRQVIYNPSFSTVQPGTISWGTILAGAGIGGLLGWMLKDDAYDGFGQTLPRYNCTTDRVEVVPGDPDGNSRVTSTIVGAGLGALLAYLAQPTQHVSPNPAAGRDRYLAELAYKQQLDSVGVKAIGQIAIQIAIDNYIASKQRDLIRSIANDQAALANRQLVMAEKEYCRYTTVFAPVEDATMAQVAADPRYVPQYELHMGRARNDAARAFGKAITGLNRKLSRYCAGANANLLREIHSEWARTEVDAVNHAWRYEELQAWRRDDVQFNRRLQLFNVGRSLQASATGDMRAATAAIGGANEALMGGISGYYGALQASFGRFSGYLMQQSRANGLQSFGLGTAMLARGLPGGSGEIDTDPASDDSLFTLRDARGLAARAAPFA
jgi:hypothetical protein